MSERLTKREVDALLGAASFVLAGEVDEAVQIEGCDEDQVRDALDSAHDKLSRRLDRMERAWFLSMHDPTNDATHDVLYDCAGSLANAKKIGRNMAEEFGYQGPFAWRRHPEHENWWNLRATWDDDWYRE